MVKLRLNVARVDAEGRSTRFFDATLRDAFAITFAPILL
jgi:hypothetical protein